VIEEPHRGGLDPLGLSNIEKNEGLLSVRSRLLCTHLIVRRCQLVGFQTLGRFILIACHWFLSVS
jgi:hypothetical protein